MSDFKTFENYYEFLKKTLIKYNYIVIEKLFKGKKVIKLFISHNKTKKFIFHIDFIINNDLELIKYNLPTYNSYVYLQKKLYLKAIYGSDFMNIYLIQEHVDMLQYFKKYYKFIKI